MTPHVESEDASSTRRRWLRGGVRFAASCVGLSSATQHLFAGLTAARQQPQPVPSVHERIRSDAADAPLAMRFAGKSRDECEAWQAKFRAKLLELLGNPRPPARWQVVREAELRWPDHVREELVLTADRVAPLPIHVLRPATGSGPWPAVLCVHGHGAFGHDAVAGKDDDPEVARAIAASNYDYARQLVREGFLTAAPCLTPFGRRLGDRAGYGNQDPCAVTFIRQQLLGRVLMGENLRDLLWTLDYLRTRSDAAADRQGCVGLSYGGRMTMLTAAVEPRVRVAVVSGALNVMQERVQGHYSCGAQVIPNLLQFGDVPEIASLVAPRPLLFEVGRDDKLIDPRWADIALERIRRAYDAFDAHITVDSFLAGHVWHGALAVPFLQRALRA